ncbi:MAG: hypothetical protein FGM44_10785, partial [Limnohabitans sp.]|nr:hypothetical protein [Limnohabitans sp.]
ATLGTDTGNAGTSVPLQYFNGTSWVDYTPNSYVQIPTGGTTLQVRTAITNDSGYEGAETFNLIATNTAGASATGVGTIVDDGTGAIYKYSGSSSATPLSPNDASYPALDDDRTPSVTGTTVNEASPYVMFKVSGVEDQKLSLTLAGGTATLGTDTALASSMEYFNGTAWVTYTGGFITMPNDGNATPGQAASVLVRLAVKPDTLNEGAETLTLTAATTSGASSTGTSTIKDDGTGSVFLSGNTSPSLTPDTSGTGFPAQLDDDRPLSVNNVTVGESDGYAVFTVSSATGVTGQKITLALQATTNAADNASLALDTGNALQYSNDGGVSWNNYTSGSVITMTGNTLQVRTAILTDSLIENPETFKVVATNTGGTSATGIGTINDNQNPIAKPDVATATEQGTADTSSLSGVNGGSSGGNAVGNVITGVVTGVIAGTNTADDPTDGGTPTVTAVINTAKTATTTTVSAGSTSTSTPASAPGLYGTLKVGADGSYIYEVDNANAAVEALRLSTNTLTDTFTYTLSDGRGGTSTSTLTITIQGANDKPTAQPDYNVAKESLLANGNASQYTTSDPLGYKATGNVLPNDGDVDAGDGKSIVGLTGSATATTVSSSSTVLNFSSAPSNVKAGYYVFLGGSGAGNKLLDANGNPIQVSPTYTSGSSIALTGTVTYKGTTGTTYTLAGTETLYFSLKADGSGSNGTATITGTSSAASSGTSLSLTAPAGSVVVGMTVAGTGVTAGTTITGVTHDASGNVTGIVLSQAATLTNAALTFSAPTGTTVTGDYGTLTFNADGLGSYIYTPFANNPDLSEGESVTEVFTYKMQDTLGATSTTTLTITVLGSGTNDPNAVADVNSVTEASDSTAATVTTSTNVLTNDTTATGTLSVMGARAPGDANFTAVTAGGTVITGLYGSLTISANGSYTYALDNTNAQVQALNAGQTLTEQFQYEVKNGLTAVASPNPLLVDVATLTITINGANDSPTLDLNTVDASTSNYATSFTEGGSAVSLLTASGVNIADVDSTTFESLRLTYDKTKFTDTLAGASAEILKVTGATSGGSLVMGTLTNGGTGTVVLNSVTYRYTVSESGNNVTLTFEKLVSSSAVEMTKAETEALLDALSYQNTAENPTGGSLRVFSLSVVDGGTASAQNGVGVLPSNIATSTITVNPVNDPPVLDLDANNSSNATGADYKGSFTVGSTAVGIADTDSAVTDVDSANMTGATIVLTNAKVGDTLSVLGSLPAGISASAAVTATADGTLTISLSGSASLASYETALEAIRFAATGTNYTDRVFQVSVTDGVASSNTAVATLAVNPDNRALTVTGTTVNEASPYVVFTVGGVANQRVTLELGTSGTATAGVDTTNAGTLVPLQYFNGTSWVDYTPGSVVTLDGAGQLLVRTGVSNDTTYEGAETLPLIARNDAGATASGNSTIMDDGTGVLYKADDPTTAGVDESLPVGGVVPTVSPATGAVVTPTASAPLLNDDRVLTVNSVTVNEASPYATFTVTGAAAGQYVKLALGSTTNVTGNATLGTDTGNAGTSVPLQYFNGTSWVDYTPNSYVQIPTGGTTLQVRTAITNDSGYEGPETFNLVATNTGGTSATGVGTIVDDGTGTVFSYPNGNTVTPAAQPAASALDDDRALSVNSVTVNEASPYATFTVTGAAAGQYVKLALGSTTNAMGNATLGTDTGNAGTGSTPNVPLQYFNGTSWVDYTPNSYVQIPTGGTTLLVRTAITNDSGYEGPETFNLIATNTGGSSATGVGTIVDDGTGTVFSYPNAGTATPNAQPAASTLDDDRVLSVNSIAVNETSPYATFTVTGAAAGQYVKLSLDTTGNGTGHVNLSADTGNALEYFNGTSWVSYAPGSFVQIPAGGTTLSVRVAITNDTTYEGPETWVLKATNTGGTTATGQGTILDDGTGSLFQYSSPTSATPQTVTPANPLTTPMVDPTTTPLLNDDRPVSVNNVTVNEGSPYAVFTVTAVEGQYVKLDLGAAGDTAQLGVDLANFLEYWNGSAWTAYVPGAYVAVPHDGDSTANEPANLLVRVAITNDAMPDNGETFTLKATNAGGSSATGVGTIKDDGTGTYFASTTTTTGVTPASASALATPLTITPADPTTTPVVNPASATLLNDDRPVSVNDVTVNEGSPYAVFTVTGVEGQYVKLDLGVAGDTATLGTDLANALEYWNGSAWTPYTPGTFVAVPTDGDATPGEDANLLVRVAITNDTTPDNGETFTLKASNTGGTFDTGTGTIQD